MNNIQYITNSVATAQRKSYSQSSLLCNIVSRERYKRILDKNNHTHFSLSSSVLSYGGGDE